MKQKLPMKRCSVVLDRLNATKVNKLCKQKILSTDIKNPSTPVETRYRTRSSLKPKQARLGRLPRSVSTNVSYEISGASSEEDKSPAPKRHKKIWPKREPSSSRRKADNFVTKPPPVTPLRRSTRNTGPRSTNAMNASTVQNQGTPATPTLPTDNKDSAIASTSNATTNPKGDFKTKSYRLKRSKKPRRFGCKMCEKFCNSIHELSVHHQQSHNILYCDICNKAFNNPASLA